MALVDWYDFLSTSRFKPGDKVWITPPRMEPFVAKLVEQSAEAEAYAQAAGYMPEPWWKFDPEDPNVIALLKEHYFGLIVAAENRIAPYRHVASDE